jgi:RNA polymerase sigma factor (sigma-70 family)
MPFADAAREHLDDVFRFVLYTTGDRLVAEDVTADTMERAFRHRSKYDPRRGSARTWLLAVARSAIIDHYRREQRRVRSEQLAASGRQTADSAGISDALSAALEEALRALSASDRELIALRVVLDLDGPTTARLLRISPSACSTRLARALTRLELEMPNHACL